MNKKTILVIFLAICISIQPSIFANAALSDSIYRDQMIEKYQDKVVVMQTYMGNLAVELFPADAPHHVENFVKLAEDESYNDTLFHRIIPGFMIQGGDPYTTDEDTDYWGTGDSGHKVVQEFNNIKHNRGIVSMARTNEVNSASTQFFIVHENSYFLDGQQTVFGRLATLESFETLDKIASVKRTERDMPADPEQVRISNVLILDKSEVNNLIPFAEPERFVVDISAPNPAFVTKLDEVTFAIPNEWAGQERLTTSKNTPDFTVVGPINGTVNPVVSLSISDLNNSTLDDLIIEKNRMSKDLVDIGILNVISQEKISIPITGGYYNQSYVTVADAKFSINGTVNNIKFMEVVFQSDRKFFTFIYSNDINDFDSRLKEFTSMLKSFKVES